MSKSLVRVPLTLLLGCNAVTYAVCQELDAEVNALFESNEFDPSLIPFQPTGFPVNSIDPLVIAAEWESVRPRLIDIYAPHLLLDDPPQLELAFAKVPSQHGEYRVRAYMLVPQNEPLRRALLRHLRCPPDTFVDAAIVFETRVIEHARIHSKYRSADGLNLRRIRADLLDLVLANAGPFARYHLSADSTVTQDRVEVLSGWHFYRQLDTKRYFWRIYIRLEKEGDSEWNLITDIDVGRQLAAQATPKKIGAASNGNVILGISGESPVEVVPVSRTIGNEIDVLPAARVSPLGTLRRTLTTECLDVLLSS